MIKDSLLQKLKLLRPALGNPIIKGLDCYLFTGNQVAAYNGSLAMKTTLDEPFPVTGAVHGESLYKLINELGKEIELSALDPKTLLVRSGRSRTKFSVEEVDTAYLNDMEDSVTIIVLPTQMMFAAGIKRCMTSLTGKSLSIENAGIHIFMDNDECRMYSTNNTTYSRFLFPLEGIITNSVFLPATFCEVLLAAYAELNIEPNSIVMTDRYVKAQFGELHIRSNLYANPVNMDLRNLMDAGIEEVSIVDLPPTLSEAIKLAETIASETTVGLSWNDGKMFVTAIGNKSQEMLEEVELSYPGNGDLKFDLKGLRKVMDTCKEIGLGTDYMLLIGSEKCFDHIVMSKQ